MSESLNRRNAILAAGALAATAGVAAAQRFEEVTKKAADDVQPPFDDKPVAEAPSHPLKLSIHLADGQVVEMTALQVDIKFIDDTCLTVSQSGAKPIASPMRS